MDNSANIQDYSRVWKVEKFSTLNGKIRGPHFFADEETKCVIVLYPYALFSPVKDFISIFINILTPSISIPAKYELTISILSTDPSLNVSKKISISCVKKKSFHGFDWFMRREELFANSNAYLPQDVLTIQCYLVRKGDLPDFSIREEDPQSESRMEGLNNDLHCLNMDDEFPDIKIETDNESPDFKIETNEGTFSVHKAIICKKSPVFNAMFENDTEVKESGIVHVTDLESETMNLILTFLYSGSIEDLNEDQASKLYTASDNYKILPLKQHCSSVLKKCLSDANVCEIYSLADIHQDEDLKNAVEEYVFIYSTRILKSSNWLAFMESNDKLSAEFMHKLWIKQLDS